MLNVLYTILTVVCGLLLFRFFYEVPRQLAAIARAATAIAAAILIYTDNHTTEEGNNNESNS